MIDDDGNRQEAADLLSHRLGELVFVGGRFWRVRSNFKFDNYL
jgi:hypothetical protein